MGLCLNWVKIKSLILQIGRYKFIKKDLKKKYVVYFLDKSKIIQSFFIPHWPKFLKCLNFQSKDQKNKYEGIWWF